MHVRKSLLRISLATILGAGMVLPPVLASATTVTTGKAKITMVEARAIALKAYPGKIVSEELEREGGGSGLRYSFDLRQGKKWREVGVDAMTGHVLENSAENANPKD